MSNRITEAEYAHYALTYAAAKMSAPLPPHSNHREAVLSALAVDDAKCILGVLPCMTNGEDGRKLVDLYGVEANGQKILALYYPRGYNVQELLDGAREMAKSASMQNIDSVSARLHATLGGEVVEVATPTDPRKIAEEVGSYIAEAFKRASQQR